MKPSYVYATHPTKPNLVVGKVTSNGRTFIRSKDSLKASYLKGDTTTGLTVSPVRFKKLNFVELEIFLLLNN